MKRLTQAANYYIIIQTNITEATGMVSYYEDENLCSQYVTDVKLSFGSKRKKLLKELCKFKTAAADEFWREKIRAAAMSFPIILQTA